MGTLSLDSLIEALRDEFRHEARGSHIAELLSTYARTATDWRAFALFNDQNYTRNLVVREDRFELLFLCWGTGQESPIHNHESQDCWMCVIEGRVEEVRYCIPEEVRTGPLEASGSHVFAQGEVAFIRDEIGLHLVRSAASDEPAISCHLYAAPSDQCNVYCPDTGKVTCQDLQNYSVRGRILTTGTDG